MILQVVGKDTYNRPLDASHGKFPFPRADDLACLKDTWYSFFFVSQEPQKQMNPAVL